jgi:hypothetical protein
MPQVIARYDHKVFETISQVRNLGFAIRRLVAEAASTERVPFTTKDIEWLPRVNGNGSIAPDFAIEIRTIGFPDRKEKMNEAAMRKLKEEILALPEFPESCRDLPSLIWVQFTDPDGVHV